MKRYKHEITINCTPFYADTKSELATKIEAHLRRFLEQNTLAPIMIAGKASSAIGWIAHDGTWGYRAFDTPHFRKHGEKVASQPTVGVSPGGKGRDACECAMRTDCAQREYEPETDNWQDGYALLTTPQSRADYLAWVRFQRAHRHAMKVMGMSRDAAHEWTRDNSGPFTVDVPPEERLT